MIKAGNQHIQEVDDLLARNDLPRFSLEEYQKEDKKDSSVAFFEGIPLTADLDLWRKTCQPQDGLVFLKKHKTASTTMQYIVDKWLRSIGAKEKRERPQMFPQGGCFPAKFNALCWGGSKRNDPVLGKQA